MKNLILSWAMGIAAIASLIVAAITGIAWWWFS